MKLLIAALLVAGATAMCPSNCNGHGACEQWDTCNCYRNWQGKDCSERTCPYTISWASQTTSGDVHTYEECGSKGLCDRKSGQCECFEGYEGKGCARSACPSNCNGHGTCETIDEGVTYTGWDAKKIQFCRCDPGYEGWACESRMCKPGDDPMTSMDDGLSAQQTAEEQVITFSSASSAKLTAGQFTITYTDWRGEQWVTWALDLAAISASAIQEALQALPNDAIPSITVVDQTTSASNKFKITFSDPATTGNQKPLVINTAACTADGCQPITNGISSTNCGGTCSALGTVTSTDGTTENAVCSNRGTCDGETGLCECYEGYYGESCDEQTIII